MTSFLALRASVVRICGVSIYSLGNVLRVSVAEWTLSLTI